jgi:trans-aconitate 2-methyltransferase
MVTNSKYTFGDSAEASARLKRLADLYAPETRSLLARGAARQLKVAVDLGCGPGWSTELLHDVLRPKRTIGFDASERFIAEARVNHEPGLEFQVHDVAGGAFPSPPPDVLLCRFLLTHLAPVGDALAAWARSASPNATLFIHETESLQAENPTLGRYYTLVGRLQQHYGQALYIGGSLDAIAENSGWKIVESKLLRLKKPAQKMAQLHAPNLRTWRLDKFVEETFAARELDSLEASLNRIADGEEGAGVVVNTARQIIASRA